MPKFLSLFTIWALYCTSLASASLPDYSLPGPFPTAQKSIGLTNTAGAPFTAQVFYPGTSDAFNTSAGRTPVLSFAHGYSGPVLVYINLLKHFASWGITSVATDSEGGPFPNQTQYAYDILTCFEGVAKDPFFEGNVDLAKKAVGGHSMGGGSSIVAAYLDKLSNNGSTTLRAVLGHAAAGSRLFTNGQNQTAVQLIGQLDLPIRLISGTGDTIVPYAVNKAMYDNARGAPVQLIAIEGAGHCGFIDLDLQVALCGAESLERSKARVLVKKLSTEFLLLHLNGLGVNPDNGGVVNGLWDAVWGVGLGVQPANVTANLSNPHFTLSKPPTSNSALSLSSTFPTPQKYKIISSVNGTQLASVTVPGNGSVGVASGDVVVPQGAVVRAVRVTEGSGDGVTGGVVGGNGSNGTVVTTTKPSGVGRKKPGFVEVGLVGFVVVGLGLIV